MSTWTRGEIEVIAGAVREAPSVHGTRACALEFHARDVSLFERLDSALPRHDPLGRDRLVSCGAALENLLLAVRILGWQPELALRPPGSGEIARVTVTGRREPSSVDITRFFVMSRRHSYRRPFGGPASPTAVRRLVTAPDVDGVEVRPVRDEELPVLAQLLEHTALVLRADRAYQRELTALAPRTPSRPSTLPWAGLVTRETHVPDVPTLVTRLANETVLVVETPDDGPCDHLRAGMAVQAIWLAASADGLVGSVLTQPLQLSEVRSGLVEGLHLAGFPQALLRFGIPDEEDQP